MHTWILIMAESLAILGLAANIISFIDFAFKVYYRPSKCTFFLYDCAATYSTSRLAAENLR